MSSEDSENIFSIGERWVSERKRLGLNQDQVAEALVTSRRTIVSYEAGQPPKLKYLIRFWRAGADIQYILTGERARMDAQDPATPAAKLSKAIYGMHLSSSDADLLQAMAQRLDAGRRSGPPDPV